MAGMLPGVEAARRRRVHQNNININTSRRSSFCLYATTITHDFHLSNSPSMRKAFCDESSLGAEAREAKKRLDQRLWRSQTTRSLEEIRGASSELVPKLKKNESKRLRWLKLMSWKSSEQEECAVCLEQLKAAPPMQLPCGHSFHTNCLLPWLQANALCPCCRMHIPSSFFHSKSNQHQ